MINVIHGGGNAFAALAYPEINPINFNYIEQQFSNFGQTLNEVGRAFFEGGKAIFEKIHNNDAVRAAKAAINAAKGAFKPNVIINLDTLEEIQQAKPVMQRWIMANPYVREIYHNQQCCGYDGSYVDMYPNDIGEAHYDYRRVMNGMVVEDDEGWYVTEYVEDLVEGDRHLQFDEQCDILKTWDLAELFMRKKEDVTSQFGDKLS